MKHGVKGDTPRQAGTAEVYSIVTVPEKRYEWSSASFFFSDLLDIATAEAIPVISAAVQRWDCFRGS
jgi:hypothetical protein